MSCGNSFVMNGVQGRWSCIQSWLVEQKGDTHILFFEYRDELCISRRN